MDIFDISASAMTAQRLRLDTIAGNLANVNTTRKADGTVGAYKRKEVVFAPIYQNSQRKIHGIGVEDLSGTIPMKPAPSGVSIGPDGRPILNIGVRHTNYEGNGVQVLAVEDDTKTPMQMIFDPKHPDANKDGFVEMPNINVVKEMVDMISANRAYEANVTALQSGKSMLSASLQI